MGDGGLKPFRDLTTGVIGAVATLATAAAGVLGVLHETGYLKAGATASPAVIAVPVNIAAPAPQNVIASTNPSIGDAGRDVSMARAVTNPQGPPNQFRRRPRLRNQEPPTSSMDTAMASANPAPAREFAARRYGQTDDNAPARACQNGAAPADEIASVQPIAVNGAWRDSGMGYCHVIKQTGAKLEVVNLAPITSTFVSAGVGTVKGREIHLRLNALKPNSANAELYLSDDGNKLIGTVRRPDGEHPTAWHRIGATCG
jgi:hypothetical protein